MLHYLLSNNKQDVIHKFEWPVDISGTYNRMTITQRIDKTFDDVQVARKLSKVYHNLFKDDRPGALGDHTNYEIISAEKLSNINNAISQC
jgi:hypothetical protein